ncbi:VOC family protein [Umezawaea endophytica]|uniref:VOC family protein n=1 Tax=Umezawaea endophytica TaxID=1654476 RepID=A0A9X3A020_9PSEU|nr:VOC family protein [Umezawaea endophytica]MCS7478079.1 VOC family protein [Umezawaea endophytica]
MSYVTGVQPNGTPTWIDLGIPDLERAQEFYGALFGWEFVSAGAEAGHYTTALLDGRRVAALAPNEGESEFWWNVYFAVDDCDSVAKGVVEAGGRVTVEPVDVMAQGRMAIALDPTGAQFGLWQARDHIGCEVVNEPNSLVRNDLVTPSAGPAREFYSSLFGFSLDRNEDVPDFDFTFLRRRDGHEIGGIFGNPEAARSRWETTFEVADTDAALARAVASGGVAGEASDMVYGRIATITDPFGTEFSVITRA